VSKPITSSSAGLPVAVRPAFEAIIAELDTFAKAHLPEEYVPLLHEAAVALARKRPSPTANLASMKASRSSNSRGRGSRSRTLQAGEVGRNSTAGCVLAGRIFIHLGDDSAFTAEKSTRRAVTHKARA
jgi:hypothetical protein